MFLVWFVVEFFWKSVSGKAIPWLSAGLGVIMAIGAALASGVSWTDALAGGLLTGTSASGFWSLFGKFILEKVRNERKNPKPKPEEKPEKGSDKADEEPTAPNVEPPKE
jgi:hypothetical protein